MSGTPSFSVLCGGRLVKKVHFEIKVFTGIVLSTVM